MQRYEFRMGRKLLCVAGIVAIVVTGCGPKEPTFQGHNMVQWLKILRANTNSSDDPLKIVQIVNDNESRNVEVEVPMSYDLSKEHGFLRYNGKFDLIINGRFLSTYCMRATNGNCLLELDKNDLHPGTNQIQVYFLISNPSDIDHSLYATGPVTEYVSTNININICHVNPYIGSTYFKGVILYADLAASNAIFSIELQDTNGNHIKTITGNTSNGIINERWTLTDDDGNKYTNDSINAVYHVTISNSLSETKTQLYNIEHP